MELIVETAWSAADRGGLCEGEADPDTRSKRNIKERKCYERRTLHRSSGQRGS